MRPVRAPDDAVGIGCDECLGERGRTGALLVDLCGSVLPSLRRALHHRGLVWETIAAGVWREGWPRPLCHFSKACGLANHKRR
jgi:hypothetical protein